MHCTEDFLVCREIASMLQCFDTDRWSSGRIPVSTFQKNLGNFLSSHAVALLVGHRPCDLQVAGSSSGWALFHSGHGQATYTCVPLSPSSII